MPPYSLHTAQIGRTQMDRFSRRMVFTSLNNPPIMKLISQLHTHFNPTVNLLHMTQVKETSDSCFASLS